MKKSFAITILLLLVEITNGQFRVLVTDPIQKEITKLDSTGNSDGYFEFIPSKQFRFILYYSRGSLIGLMINDVKGSASYSIRDKKLEGGMVSYDNYTHEATTMGYFQNDSACEKWFIVIPDSLSSSGRLKGLYPSKYFKVGIWNYTHWGILVRREEYDEKGIKMWEEKYDKNEHLIIRVTYKKK